MKRTLVVDAQGLRQLHRLVATVNAGWVWAEPPGSVMLAGVRLERLGNGRHWSAVLQFWSGIVPGALLLREPADWSAIEASRRLAHPPKAMLDSAPAAR